MASKSNSTKKKNNNRKNITKNPVFIVLVVCLIIGLGIGFLVGSFTTEFKTSDFIFNGTKTEKNDYLHIELSLIKENLESENENTPVTDEQIKNAIKVEDNVTIKFFGKDLSDTVIRTYYYREDMSFEAKEVDEIDYTKAGIYYITYTSSHFAFKNHKLIRTIEITGAETDG